MCKEKAGCFALFVFLVSYDCCVALPRGATGLFAVCDCGISCNRHIDKQASRHVLLLESTSLGTLVSNHLI